jgi:hypothetical protein
MSTGNGVQIEQHCDDTCDECGSKMSMTRTRYPEHDFLQWFCINDDCGGHECRHEYPFEHQQRTLGE